MRKQNIDELSRPFDSKEITGTARHAWYWYVGYAGLVVGLIAVLYFGAVVCLSIL